MNVILYFIFRIWDINHNEECLELLEDHNEFVYGIDWNLNHPNQLADCAWDSTVNVYNPKSLNDF